LSTRRRGRRGGVPLVRTPRTLPRVLEPAEVNALVGALRRWRDRAMVEAMLLGGLRGWEVLGLCLEDLRAAECRVFIADGKGGRQRLVPISARFFASVARYLDAERPPSCASSRPSGPYGATSAKPSHENCAATDLAHHPPPRPPPDPPEPIGELISPSAAAPSQSMMPR
jgi:integrase